MYHFLDSWKCGINGPIFSCVLQNLVPMSLRKIVYNFIHKIYAIFHEKQKHRTKKNPENKKSNVSKVLFKLNKAPIQLKDLMSTEYEVALAMSVFGYVV